ncbi:type 4a pilus biogenesis protein PilO [Mangrovihabitans endophyticus]|uniref:Type IV pilus assembly protein PilO n=1 Tax=Mangrovihabitans endophyticus TaxID=1751298 RepID=A0A8J3BZ71_9ACTN|nr:type 4a pilus biogenesis protein PilO [Mangrovihabitans endophyticus]GGK86506.1 hypothetical protein GCM10012284_20880 [Mangrovihabitans endophyticus]
MGRFRADRVWQAAGLAVILLLAAGGWFLFIGPKYAEADETRAERETVEIQTITLRKRVGQLKQESDELPKYKAALKQAQAALPADSGVPDFLRQLQASGDELGVDVNGISVAAPSEVVEQAGVYELPMTVSVNGTAARLSSFLTRMQSAQPRAVLITAATLTSQGTSGSTSTDSTSTDSAGTDENGGDAGDADQAATMTLSLALKAYVIPPAGTGAPTVTSK